MKMTPENLDIKEIKERLEKFKQANIPVHIVLKATEKEKAIFRSYNSDIIPRFLNGLIMGKKSDDVYIIDEKKLGETYVLIDDIYNVSVYVKSNRELSEEIIEKTGMKMDPSVSKDEINLLRNVGYDKKNKKW